MEQNKEQKGSFAGIEHNHKTKKSSTAERHWEECLKVQTHFKDFFVSGRQPRCGFLSFSQNFVSFLFQRMT